MAAVMPNITGTTILMHVPSPGPQYVPQARSANLHLNFIHFVSQLLPKENKIAIVARNTADTIIGG